MKIAKITQKIKELPQNPGVYVFYDKKGEIIYIGKATNLKSRVSSYFRLHNTNLQIYANDANMRIAISRPIEEMIHRVADIEVQETESVLEALILEANLIKKHQPKYNVLGKDDKSYAYFVITKEDFPRVLILRKTDLFMKHETYSMKQKDKKNVSCFMLHVTCYGPYTSKKQMEIALKIIRKIFPFHSNVQKTEKGCLDFQLGRCPGPYAGAISKTDYAKNIRGIKMILEGKKKSLLKKMEKEMSGLAKKEEFEKATEIRNKIFALQHIQDVALISSGDENFQISNLKSQTNSKSKIQKVKNFRIEAYDISNLSGQHAVGSMVVFENGEMNKNEYRKFKIKTVDGSNDVAMMKEVLARRLKNPWTQPDLILLDGGLGHLNMAQKLFNDLGFIIPLVSVAKGPTRKKLELHLGKNRLDKSVEGILYDENLIKSIMDEAHRFAITYHRKVRKKEFISR